MTRRPRLLAVLVSLLPLVLAACSADPHAPDAPPSLPAVTVGSSTSTTGHLIARLYAGALQRMGSHVTTRFDLGDHNAVMSALDADQVTVAPAFTASLLKHLQPAADPREPKEVAAAVSGSLPQGLSVSDISDTTDWRAAITLTEASATHFDAHSLKELAPHCAELTLGITDPAPALEPLHTEYGCTFAAVRHFPSDALAAALARGDVQAAVLAPPADTAPGLVALSDDKYAIPADNPLPVFRTGELSQAQIKKLNLVAGELNTNDLTKMVQDIDSGKLPATEVAHTWLDRHGF